MITEFYFLGVNYPFKWQHPSRVVTIYWYDGLSRFERAHLSYRKHLHIYGLKKMNETKNPPTHLQLIFTQLLHLTAYMHIQRRKWQTQKKKKFKSSVWEHLQKQKWTRGCPWGQIQFAKNVDAKWLQKQAIMFAHIRGHHPSVQIKVCRIYKNV